MKLVLGDFSSGVCICRNKRTRSDLRAPFFPGSPGRGVWGALVEVIPVLYLVVGT